jgi:hypothetical protein
MVSLSVGYTFQGKGISLDNSYNLNDNAPTEETFPKHILSRYIPQIIIHFVMLKTCFVGFRFENTD